MNSGFFRCSIPLVALAALACLPGCEPTKAAKVAKNPRVIVTTPITDKVIDYQDFTGRLEAYKAVEIRSRVTGYVMQAIQPRDAKLTGADGEIKVREGDLVAEGQLLFVIDPRQYLADLTQADANLKLAIADRNFMAKNADRARGMLARKAMTQEDYERDMAAYDKAIAQVGAVEAMKEKAKLYVDYTQIKAPVSGRISRRFVDPGNLCSADSTLLTTIVTEDPMYAYFDVDERTYLDLLATVAPGQKTWMEGMHIPVMMRLANENEFERVGEIDFVDNRIVSTTGTVRMRGVFKNDSGLLKAGLFVRIRLPMGSIYDPIIIPDEAIQSDQEQKYVWVVNSNNVAEYRTVRIGQAVKSLRVIKPATKGKEGKEGLSPGERVVISGMQRVRSGTQVDAEDQPPPEAPHMPLVRLVQKDDKVTR